MLSPHTPQAFVHCYLVWNSILKSFVCFCHIFLGLLFFLLSSVLMSWTFFATYFSCLPILCSNGNSLSCSPSPFLSFYSMLLHIFVSYRTFSADFTNLPLPPYLHHHHYGQLWILHCPCHKSICGGPPELWVYLSCATACPREQIEVTLG